MYTKYFVLGVTTLLGSSHSLADTSCAEECRLRSSFGNRLVKGPEEEFKKAEEYFNQITKDNITACREACAFENTPKDCKVCAKQTLPDNVLKDQKEQLDSFSCTEGSDEEGGEKCLALQQPKFDYSRPETRRKGGAVFAQQCIDETLKAGDEAAKKSKDLERQADALYDEGFDETKTPVVAVRQSKVMAADQLDLQSTLEKLKEVDARDYLNETPFDPAKNFCIPACSAKLPINNIALAGDQNIYNEAMWAIPAMIRKATYECVRACALKPNAECGACADSTLDAQFLGSLYGTIGARFACGVVPDRPPPTAGQIVLQTFADLIAGAADPGCPRMNGISGGIGILPGRIIYDCTLHFLPKK